MSNTKKRERELLEKLSSPSFDFSSKDKEGLTQLKDKIDLALQYIYLKEQTEELQTKVFYLNANQKFADTTTVDFKNQQIDLVELASNLSELHRQILLVIGQEGLSVAYKIVNRIAEDSEIETSDIRHALKELYDEFNVLSEEDGTTPLSPRLLVYSFNYLGKALYRYLFNDDPIKSEAETLISKYGSIREAIFLQDVEVVLSQTNKYKKITLIEKNSQTFFNICTKSQKNEEDYWLVLSSKPKLKRFSNALNLARGRTDSLYVIVRNRDDFEHAKVLVEEYIRQERYGKENEGKVRKELILYMGTINQLLDGSISTNVNCKFLVR